MTANDVDATMGRPLQRSRQFERRMRDGGHGKRRRGQGDKRIQTDGAVVILGAEGWPLRRMMLSSVTGPVRMNGPAVVMVRRVVVGMCVDERGVQSGGRERQRQGEGEQLTHDASLFVAFKSSVKRWAQGHRHR